MSLIQSWRGKSVRKNQTSPSWAIAKWFHIVKDGRLYLKRLRVIQTPWFAFYIHWIYLPDQDRDPHDHPWHFASFILHGGYEEVVSHPANGTTISTRSWRRGSFHQMPIEDAHRILTLQPKTVTLIFTGRRRRTWGFWTPEGFVPYYEYDNLNGPDPFNS